MIPQALKTRLARWLRLPERRIFSRPLIWLIVLALFAVLAGVTIIARVALDLTSPRVTRYAADLSARNQADYSFWPFGPLIPPVNPEVIAAAELDRLAPDAPGNLPAPTSVPIVFIGPPTVPALPSETPTPTASPSPTPTASPTTVPSPTSVVASRRAPTSAAEPVRQVIPTATPQEQPSATPITNPNEPPATPPPPTATAPSPPPTATPTPTATAPVQTPVPSPSPTTPPATPTAVPPQPTSTPSPTSTPEPPLEVSFAAATLVVSEAQGRAAIEVRLSRLPSTTVTVAYATGGGTATPGVDYRPASGTLTFAPGAIARSFTIEILSDELNEPNETVEIRLSNPVNAVIVGSGVAILTITDSDAPPTARFAGERRVVPENAGSAAVTVELDRPAAIDVVVPYAVSGTAGPADHSLRAGALIIPAGATGARLRFTIVDDQIDEDDEYIVVTLGTPSNAGLGSPSVYLFTLVDDDAAGVTLSETAFTLDEGASSAYTVVLESEPAAPVTIELIPDSQVQVVPDRLVFTPANWRVPQTVRLTAVDDNVEEGDNARETHPGRVTHRVISGDQFYARLTVPTVTVAIRDNDDAGVLVSPQLLRLTEAPGSTQAAAYTVRLRSQPTAPVMVTITFDQELTINGVATDATELTFTPANWNIPQEVQVRAVDDAVDEDGDGNRSVHASLIRHGASSSDPFYNRDAPELQPVVRVEIADNDDAGVLVSPQLLRLTEAPGSTQAAVYTARLRSQPTAPVTVIITFDQEVIVNGVTTGTVNLNFTPATWNVAQTVQVRAVDDAVDEDGDGNQSIHRSSIRHRASSADRFYDRDVAELQPVVTVEITDNDTAALLLPTGPLTVTEGQSLTYPVRLATEPVRPVTITLTVSGPVTVSSTSLVFDRDIREQTVTITAPDNYVDAPDAAATITHTIQTADPVYSTLPPGTLAVRVLDDDEAGVLVNPQLLRLTEAPGLVPVATYTVRLRSQPTAPVTVTITFDREVTVNDVTTGTVNLNFTAANWNTPQAVQVRAVDDAVDEDGDGNQSVHRSLIRHSAASADPFYNRNVPELQPVVSVEISDNDTAGLEVSTPSGWTTSEDGDSVTFTVRLTSQPLAPVAVRALTSDPTEARVSDPAMPPVFDALTWNRPITVTVSGVDDDLFDGPIPYAVSVMLDAASGYAPLAGVTEIRLTNLDNDRVPASFVQAESVVREDAGEARLGVRLVQTLTYTVTVGYETLPGTAAPGEDYTPVSGVLTFAPGDLVQTIALPILDNDDASEDRYETVQVLLRPGEGATPGTPGLATVLIEEDDVLSPLAVAPFLVTSRALGASFLQIALPCSWPTSRALTIELWSPAVHTGPGGSADVVDPAAADGPNTTLFELYDAGSRVDPEGTTVTPAGNGLLVADTFAPSAAPEAWERWAIIADPQPCGRYLLRAQTGGDDENYWAIRVGYDHDNSPLTRLLDLSPLGAPIRVGTLLGSVEVRPSADVPLCMTTWVYVAPGTTELLLNNFDLDEEEPGPSGVRLRYYAPSQIYNPLGLSGGFEGRQSGDGVWVQERFAAPESGWWRVVACSSRRNRYELEAIGDGFPLPLLYDAPY
ncbi:MAG: Calx-beta domain-containing protein [Oscillochloridaceae bacterium]|nr:hypothetical protein [Chloroflexaceae bacterium]MDW8390083.1 Calx-beta domain-containing protein [Oscillochloridaceae bacterium]